VDVSVGFFLPDDFSYFGYSINFLQAKYCMEEQLNTGNQPTERALKDLELVKLAVEKRDQNAFAKLMSRYKDSIFFMVLKMVHSRDDAEDITMESFSKAFNNIEKYDQRYAFSTWLFKIATNNCIDFIRKKRIETTSIDKTTENDKGDEISIDVKSDALNPEENMMKAQRAFSVRGSLSKLDPKYRQLIELRYYEELSYEEISEQLDLPLGTVKAQLFRAKDMLYKLIGDNIKHI
jgi:RNA polymerase sigma-70 factor (ECF subfamily)